MVVLNDFLELNRREEDSEAGGGSDKLAGEPTDKDTAGINVGAETGKTIVSLLLPREAISDLDLL